MQSDQKIECHLVIESPDQDWLLALSVETGLSKQKIKQLMKQGGVWRGKGKKIKPLRRASSSLSEGDHVYLYFDQKVFDEEPLPLTLIDDNDAYSIWVKPYGMRCQGSRWGDHCAFERCVSQVLNNRATFLVHRLDRATSGLMVIAHNKDMASKFSRYFADRQINKFYQARVNGKFPGDVQCIEASIDSKPSKTLIQSVQYNPNNDSSLLHIEIKTGRKHQIRIHLSEAGFPIIGDRLYGDGEYSAENLQLCAVKLTFPCPITGESKCYELPSNDQLGL